MPTYTPPIPRKLNQGMITALSDAIAKGNYAVTACQLCDISSVSFYAWLKQAYQDEENGLSPSESIYLCLLNSIKRAEAEAEAKLVAVVREAAEVKREWLPAITFLERRHPDRWGRKDRLQVDSNKTETVQITHVTVVESLGQIIEGEVRELPDQKQIE